MKDDEVSGAHNMLGEIRNAYKILVGNSEIGRPLGRPRHRFEGISY
jgi:hypothetical protein